LVSDLRQVDGFLRVINNTEQSSLILTEGTPRHVTLKILSWIGTDTKMWRIFTEEKISMFLTYYENKRLVLRVLLVEETGENHRPVASH
jgi:hypothetical protein